MIHPTLATKSLPYVSRFGKVSKTIQKYSSIFADIINYHITSRFVPLPPKRVLIALTYWCNSRCVMCNIWKVRPKNELTLKEWSRILSDHIFENIEAVDITGGEPTLRQDFIEVLTLFIQSMPRLHTVTLVSNGFSTQRIVVVVERLAEICRQYNIHLSVNISIDGVGKTHETIRRIPDAFKKSTATVFALKKLAERYDLSVGSGSLILRQNVSELHKMKQWYERNHVTYAFQIVGFHPVYLQNLDTKETVNYQKQDIKKILSFFLSLAKPKNWRDVWSYYWKDMLHMYRDGKPRTTPCPFQKNQFALDSLGNVHYCFSERSIGNCRNGRTVSDIYYDKKNLRFRMWMQQHSCLGCNSACNIHDAIARDVTKYVWFRVTGHPWYGIREGIKRLCH